MVINKFESKGGITRITDWRIKWVILLCFSLSGCAYQVINFPDENTGSYSANDASVSPVPRSGYHRVSRGETLFSIAFRYGKDYREVAALNHIRPPYTIYPKQKIWLEARGSVVANGTSSQSSRSSSRSRVVAKTAPVPSVSPSDITLQKKVNIPEKNSSSNIQNSEKVTSWQWPLVGKVVKGFSSNGVSSKGIDIKGQKGELVKAVADGTVVYAGSGLIGYGNLVIVKHNDVYLSAYAYNERILVKEQQHVKAGDALAIIGGKGNDRPLLHFEIRRDGQPVDPLKILPRQ